jgi:hypothetical protein
MPTESLTPYEILEKVYSEEGYSHGAASIKIQGFCNIKLFPEGDLFSVKFEESKPLIQIGKTLSIRTTISGIKMGKNGGTIEVDKFPDVPFFYSWIMSEEEDVVGFDRKDLAEMFTRAAAQKLINTLIDAVVSSVGSESKDADNE